MMLMCQVSVRKGAARSWDHAQLVDEQWLHAAVNGIEIFVKRVATDDNIADLPSCSARHDLRVRPRFVFGLCVTGVPASSRNRCCGMGAIFERFIRGRQDMGGFARALVSVRPGSQCCYASCQLLATLQSLSQ